MTSSPTRFGSYTLLERLASGGMAEIWLARQDGVAGFARQVVIKRIHSHLNADPEFVTMFLDEARLVAQLSHPNIASVHDFGMVDGSHFLVMEHVHGVALSTAIAVCKGLEAAHALRIASEMCAGLHYAHTLKDSTGRSLGIVHRDVSPQNVLLSHDGAVKLIDFGVAKASTQAHSTRAGSFKGKYAYMSPEQARSRPLDARSDVHAVGIVLWETITGRGLFHRASAYDSMQAVLTQRPPSVRRRHPELPAELDTIVARALAKDPDERYPSCGEMGVAIDELAANAGLLSSSRRLGTLVRELTGSSTGAFPIHDLEQKTDMAPTPTGEGEREGGPVADEAPGDDAERVEDPTGDFVPELGEAVDESRDDGPGTADEGVGAPAAEASPAAEGGAPPAADEPGVVEVRPARGPDLPKPDEARPDEARRGTPRPSPAPRVRPLGIRARLRPTLLLLGLGTAAVAAGAALAVRRPPPQHTVVILPPPPGPTELGPGGEDARSENADDGGRPAFEPGEGGVVSDAELLPAFLSVWSEPRGAMVSIDGRQTGERTSVHDLPVDPGAHTIELSLPGYERWRKGVVLAAGESASLRARLVTEPVAPGDSGPAPPAPREEAGVRADAGQGADYGLLSLDTTPPSRVLVDGRELGTTPLRDQEVTAGERRVTFVLPGGRRLERTVRVAPGRTTRRTFDLTPGVEPESSPAPE